ncbi:MAG: gamma-glutamyltransferase family protein [Rhodospirillaceae bacterium]|nr:gamma-glutamyltransferase family protein [Rhodospirillaceae bacterium]
MAAPLMRPELSGSFGAVASTHWIASAVGMGVLERGGNAFDAAVATGLTLTVIEPHLNGPGGECPTILYHAKTKRTVVVCGQGPLPKAASIAKFREMGLDLVPGTGFLAACVPATFDTWMHILQAYGTLGAAEAMAPAIHYAENGFPMLAPFVNTLRMVKDLFNTEWKSSAALWLRGGELPKVGEYQKNPKLAETLRRIAKQSEAAAGSREKKIEAARAAWSDGFVAEAIDRYVKTPMMDTSGKRHAGLLNGGDLSKWRAWEENPVSLEYGNYTVAKCGPWSQGPVFLQQLALLAGYDLAKMEPHGPDFIHTVVECAKLAFADREAYYGDPNFVNVPLTQLLDKAHNAERRKLIGAMASLEDRPSRLAGFKLVATPDTGVDENMAAPREDAVLGGVGEPTVRRDGFTRGDTVHLDVVDKDGNMVSATPSGGWYQSSPLIPDLGFCLGSRAQMAWLQEDHPSAIMPGKRPRTTLTPSMAMRDGEPYMAFGTPGGDQQDQWSLLVFLHHVHHGMNLQEAIEAPMFHSEHFRSSFYPRQAKPGVVQAEGRLPKATIDELRKRGHIVEVGPDWSLGRVSAVTKWQGIVRAGANPRGAQGYAVGR